MKKTLIISFSPRAAWFRRDGNNEWRVTNANTPDAVGVILSGLHVKSWGDPPYSYTQGGEVTPLNSEGFPALPEPPGGSQYIAPVFGEFVKLAEVLRLTATPLQKKWLCERFGDGLPFFSKIQYFLDFPPGFILEANLIAGAQRAGITLSENVRMPQLNAVGWNATAQNGARFFVKLWGATEAVNFDRVSIYTETGGDNQIARPVELLAFELKTNKITRVCE